MMISNALSATKTTYKARVPASPSLVASVCLPTCASPWISRRLLVTKIAHANAPTHTLCEQRGERDLADLNVRGAADRHQSEEDEDEDLAQAGISVRPLATCVIPGGQHACHTHGQQPPMLGHDHKRQSGETGDPEAGECRLHQRRRRQTGTDKPQRTDARVSVPRIPSE